MKIRTDFVTNSSSSSFVVEITLRDVNGQSYSVQIPPDDPEGDCNGNLNCSATSIMNASSVDDLVKLLARSADCGFDIDDYYGEDEEDWDWDPRAETEDAMKKFGDAIKQGIPDISQIASIKFKRIWSAWGECSSCFGSNLEYMAEELPGLAKRVCESDGEEKEVAKKEMAEYLAKFNGSIDADAGCFPSGFMGSTVTGAIVWDKFVDSIEELAEKVVAEKIPNDDHAEETTEINMQTREISQKAEYIIDGNGLSALFP